MKLNGKEYPARRKAAEPAPEPMEPEREGYERAYARVMAEIAGRRQSGIGE